MDNQNILLTPLQMGEIQLSNRICMAALTRQRCSFEDLVPNDLVVEYYTQRAEAGFILTECTPISERSGAFPGAGGIYTEAQVEGWKKVIDSVHAKGGKMIIQIWHCGRATHSTLQKGLEPWSASAIAIREVNRRANAPHEVPHAMTIDEIKQVIQEFRKGAENAKKAGFDGIQLHGAHGYLVDQFLRDGSNKRTDQYGGSVENRSRFCLEIIDQLIEVFGAGRVGIKVTPVGAFGDMNDSDPLKLYTYLFTELSNRKIAFIELKDDRDPENFFNYGYPSSKSIIPDIYKAFRNVFKGIIIGNNEFTPTTAIEGINKGDFDAITFGKLFISNPDLVNRIRNGYELNTNWDWKTFFSHTAVGYTDYPTYQKKE